MSGHYTSLTNCKKTYILRDFSNGTEVRFQTYPLPQELKHLIEEEVFKESIHQINCIFDKAEKFSVNTFIENCLGCLTAYLLFLCIDTYYEKCMKELAGLIQTLNDKVFVPRNLLLVNPMERGLRVIEVCIFDQNRSNDAAFQ